MHEINVDLPKCWEGWPGGKKFAFVLTHDIETCKGVDRCLRLADLEEELGFRSSFNFVANGYRIPQSLRDELTRRGFEVGVHGLYHNSRLYHSRKEFLRQVPMINQVLREWNAVGFRSPCMYHQLEWLHDLNILYDASTFDADPFEPQPDGVATIFPINVINSNGGGYIELPYTLPQDFTLFILMRNKAPDIWSRKLEWIIRHGGMALMITHPDYMLFKDYPKELDSNELYPFYYYTDFLKQVREKYQGEYWHVLPKTLAHYWRESLISSHQGIDRLQNVQ